MTCLKPSTNEGRTTRTHDLLQSLLSASTSLFAASEGGAGSVSGTGLSSLSSLRKIKDLYLQQQGQP